MPSRRDIEFEELDRLEEPRSSLPISPPRNNPERELEDLFSNYRARLRRLDMEQSRRENLDIVSVKFSDDELAAFRARLLAEHDDLFNANVRKQAEPERVANNIRRYQRLLDDARDPPLRSRKWSTAHVSNGGGRNVNPRTIYGTEAWIGIPFPKSWTRTGTVPRFVSKTISLPCVERSVRREVMFAKKKAGKGYRVRHRRHPFSEIWC